ncbi:hypothetical protein HMF7854_03910 [Sphingomonas ginkgonis]|uniref:Nucleotidyltransferase family protein n=1 Tax=Sphingomonas ginkgonis TaxID=2315330 RepID=A0A429V7Y0_9SPHN|nr:nucleotidyltransferase family protein [Sphingomonas ginkgonis]RST30066.1 hypothetical protein HMF7854_03910 [Sphingomonas ginkgonis]
MNARHPLRLLGAALRGQVPAGADWRSIVTVASRGWLAPALYLALSRHAKLGALDNAAAHYLELLHARNLERNRRLRRQLVEAAAALGAAGVEPVLLKGANHLFLARDEDLGARMLSDIDLSIRPAEAERASEALRELGYVPDHRGREWARVEDAATIELHARPSARAAPYLRDDLHSWSPPTARHGVQLRVPEPTARALHLIVHDMIKEGDLWTYRLDLRHLHDLYRLQVDGSSRVDWPRLARLLSDRVGRHALMVQIVALEDLFGVPIPQELAATVPAAAKLTYRRQLLATMPGPVGAVIRSAGRLSHSLALICGYSWQGSPALVRQVRRRFAPAAGSRI